jgi:hypothetical protein
MRSSRLKIAVLSDQRDSYPKPMGRGLARLLQAAGAEPVLLETGLEALPQTAAHRPRPVGREARLRALLRRLRQELAYRRLRRQLAGVDAVIVVNHLPAAYHAHFFDDARLRRDLPRLPVLLYDLIYLGSDPFWTARLAGRERDPRMPAGRHYGLNRYDHHLCVTEVNGEPLFPGTEDFSRIGLCLEDPSLHVQPNSEFSALIDFEQPAHLRERAVQVAACVEAGVPFRVLHGRYRTEEIRAEYRACGVYFLAHLESFGLPIAEVQACGASVLTPDPSWCRPHHLTRGPRTLDRLPDNIRCYDHDQSTLVRMLRQLRETHDPHRIRQRFLEQQPAFFLGDPKVLGAVVSRIASGDIHARSHLRYPDLRQMAAGTAGG